MKAASERTIEIADREVAHAQRGGAGDKRLSFREFDECVDAYADIAKKYVRILTGASMLSLEPVEQFDATDIFRFPWIPRCTGCGHSADYHREDGKGCNGAADEYRRKVRAGKTGVPSLCECTITEPGVYAQTAVPGVGE